MKQPHHIYAHAPHQPPHKGTWLLSIPHGTLALWLPLTAELVKTTSPSPQLISAVDEPPA